MRADHRLKDATREKRIFTFRALVALLFMLVLVSALVTRLYQLQLVNYQHFQTLSDKNRMQLQSIAPNRGLIYDRNGVLLADNQPIFNLAIIPEDVESIDVAIAEIKTVIEVTPDQIKRFKKQLKRSRRPFQAVVLKSKLSEKEIARIEVRRHELLGIKVQAELARHYSMGTYTAHSIGYVGRINEKELTKLDEQNYSDTNYIGKSGVEHFYEDELHGQVGFQTVEINASNRILRTLERTEPIPGRDLTLYMDSRLQKKASDLLKERRGAVVAIEPATGGILALVSTPSFDPNEFVTGIDYKSYAALRDSLDLPLFNRAIKGQYPPGSTIKPILGFGGLDSKTVTRDYSIWDEGFYKLKNDERIYRDWKRRGHGRINVTSAIVQSCDTYFYNLAFKMGVDNMSKYLGYFGIGQNPSIDISEARSGILPTREWKKALKGRAWYPGDSLNMGIGQGFMLVTPLQLATATAIIANRGRVIRPALLMSSKFYGKAGSPLNKEIKKRKIKANEFKFDNLSDMNFIIKAMSEVMHGKHGTARSSGRHAKYRMAGKTGTAQVALGSKGFSKTSHTASFAGYFPADKPKYTCSALRSSTFHSTRSR